MQVYLKDSYLTQFQKGLKSGVSNITGITSISGTIKLLIALPHTLLHPIDSLKGAYQKLRDRVEHIKAQPLEAATECTVTSLALFIVAYKIKKYFGGSKTITSSETVSKTVYETVVENQPGPSLADSFPKEKVVSAELFTEDLRNLGNWISSLNGKPPSDIPKDIKGAWFWIRLKGTNTLADWGHRKSAANCVWTPGHFDYLKKFFHGSDVDFSKVMDEKFFKMMSHLNDYLRSRKNWFTDKRALGLAKEHVQMHLFPFVRELEKGLKIGKTPSMIEVVRQVPRVITTVVEKTVTSTGEVPSWIWGMGATFVASVLFSGKKPIKAEVFPSMSANLFVQRQLQPLKPAKAAPADARTQPKPLPFERSPKFLNLKEMVRSRILYAPLTNGRKPRPYRELEQILHDIEHKLLPAKEGVKKIKEIAQGLGQKHSLYLAALKCG